MRVARGSEGAEERLGGARGGVTGGAGQATQQAWPAIARLHAAPLTRHSWRHGSIAWRSAYLASLIGRDASTLPIDRQVKWIKLAAVIALGLTGAYLFFGA